MTIEGHRVLVVVPARGGSKGIPMKNIMPIAGRPMVSRVGDLLRELPWVDRAVVSTDHLLIRDAALDSGLEAPFMRPQELSGDRIGDVDVLRHALLATEDDDGSRYDVVVMLQPTSPLRRAHHVTATVEKLLREGLDAVWTVTATDSKAHPLKQLRVDANGHLDYYDPRGAEIIARQQLDAVYHRNGAAYAMTRACLLDLGSLRGERAGAIVIDEPMVSIDTMDDVEAVEAMLATREVRAGGTAVAARPKRLVVDIDGVIAEPVPDLDYASAGPMRDNIARINALHDAGCVIILYTARGSGTGKDWSGVTVEQLQRWGVRHHELRFGKPPADYYIDDRLTTLPQALALCGLGDPVNP